VLEPDLRVESANRAFYEVFQVTPEQTVGRFLYELGGGHWDVPRLREVLQALLPRDDAVVDFEVEHEFEGLGWRTMLLNARRISGAGDKQRMLLAIEDITERKQAQTKLVAHSVQLQEVVG